MIPVPTASPAKQLIPPSSPTFYFSAPNNRTTGSITFYLFFFQTSLFHLLLLLFLLYQKVAVILLCINFRGRRSHSMITPPLSRSSWHLLGMRSRGGENHLRRKEELEKRKMPSVVLLIPILGIVTAAAATAIPSPVNAACVAAHCALQSAACFSDAMCGKNVGCVSECLSKWDDDKSTEKFMIQNCTAICTFSYTSKAYTSFMTCLAAHKCMNLPSIPNTCKGPNNITISKQVPLEDLKGSWWVIRGYHPIYDCYPCQNDTLFPHNSTTWVYSPHYEVYLANGSLGLIKQSGYLKNGTTAKEGYSIAFEDAGVSNYETWWVIDKAKDNSYVLVYYCGSLLQWYFEGAIVFAHSPTLSDADTAAITASYKAATGLDFAEFCSPDVTNCMPDGF